MTTRNALIGAAATIVAALIAAGVALQGGGTRGSKVEASHGGLAIHEEGVGSVIINPPSDPLGGPLVLSFELEIVGDGDYLHRLNQHVQEGREAILTTSDLFPRHDGGSLERALASLLGSTKKRLLLTSGKKRAHVSLSMLATHHHPRGIVSQGSSRLVFDTERESLKYIVHELGRDGELDAELGSLSRDDDIEMTLDFPPQGELRLRLLSLSMTFGSHVGTLTAAPDSFSFSHGTYSCTTALQWN